MSRASQSAGHFSDVGATQYLCAHDLRKAADCSGASRMSTLCVEQAVSTAQVQLPSMSARPLWEVMRVSALVWDMGEAMV